MPTKPLDRLMFAQGGLCFFCKKPLSKSEASVEHLVATTNGGRNNDENCVACCKAVNALFGSMSLKEKLQVVLNQRGQFKCPNGTGSATATIPLKQIPQAVAASKPPEARLNLVLANLRQRGSSRPRRLATLTSTVAALFGKGLSDGELDELIQQLQSTGTVIITDDKVTYSL